MQEWQPIETAPKDGRDILVHVKAPSANLVYIAHWGSEDWVSHYGTGGGSCLNGWKSPAYWAPYTPPKEIEGV